MRSAREYLKTLVARTAELGVVFALVFLSFLAFLGVLGLSFPHGTSLGDLMGYADTAGARGGPGLDLDLGPAPARRLPLVASLTRVFRRVDERPPDAIAWTTARAGEVLQDRHAVQTLSRSGATIAFGENQGLQLSENSLIILNRAEQEIDTRTKRAAVVLMEGELSARLEPDRREPVEVQIATGQGEFQVASSTTRPADFRLTVAADQASTLAVYEGQASVTAQGRTVVIAPNHAVTVLPGQAPGAPVLLAARPATSAPEDGAVQRIRDDAAAVRFEWEAQADAEQYRFVLARDPDFAEIVHDDKLGPNRFTHGHLRTGSYYWKVSALRGGIEGPATAAWRLAVVQDRQPPQLQIDAVAPVVETPTVLLRGLTEVGCRVLIGERDLPVAADGTFALELPLDPGLNLIVVEAIDPVGNIAYDSMTVNAKYAEKTP